MPDHTYHIILISGKYEFPFWPVASLERGPYCTDLEEAQSYYEKLIGKYVDASFRLVRYEAKKNWLWQLSGTKGDATVIKERLAIPTPHVPKPPAPVVIIPGMSNFDGWRKTNYCAIRQQWNKRCNNSTFLCVMCDKCGGSSTSTCECAWENYYNSMTPERLASGDA